MSILIKHGRVINVDSDLYSDIFIEDSKIKSIGQDLSVQADVIIDAKDKYVIPGGIDVHTHLDMPLGNITSSDDFETGTIAAAFGGTTSIIDYATQSKGSSMLEALDTWISKAESKAVIDYGFHMIITDISGNKLNDMKGLAAQGITSFKLFMAYPDSIMVDDATIYKTMKFASECGTLICMHAENGSVIDVLVKEALALGKNEPKYHALTRPVLAEAEAVNRSIAISQMAGTPVYIVHVSSAAALEEITNAQNKNIPVYAETCPQYLFLSIEDNTGKPDFEDAKFVFTPPLREKWNQDKLWDGLLNNNLNVVATDHCPFNFKSQKSLGLNNFSKIPNGGSGIEHRLELLFEGVLRNKISLNRWVDLCSASPAKLFGMYPKKGIIEEDSDADIVIWDPKAEHTISVSSHHMNVDYSMYEGKTITGKAETVISRGEILIEKNTFKGRSGRGQFIKRNTFEII